MNRGMTGDWESTAIAGEAVRAFVPRPLPPAPPLAFDLPLQRQQEQALVALGRLDAIGELLPDPQLFFYHYIRREAVLSSQIEGTQSSLSDLLLREAAPAPGFGDVRETSLAVDALEHGLQRLRGGFPLCNRLLCEMHGRLMARKRDISKRPGEFRRSQNWIGGLRPGNARYVPPPPQAVADCMAALERFLHDQSTPVLIKAALAHVQFETIHPFLDGNGRIGRLLITLLLHHERLLREPLLYLSLFFKRNRQHYYHLLSEVRQTGNWESWLAFFLTGVHEVATEAVDKAQRLTQLFESDRARINALGARAAASALAVHRQFCQHPYAAIKTLAAQTGLAFLTVQRSIERLASLQIIRETTGRRRHRIFAYPTYLQILNQDTDRPGEEGYPAAP